MEVPNLSSPGGGTSVEKLEMFKKKGEQTRIEVSVKKTNFKSLSEIKAFGYIDRQSIEKEGFVSN